MAKTDKKDAAKEQSPTKVSEAIVADGKRPAEKAADKDANRDMVKRRLLALVNLLYEKTDQDHPIDTFQIMEYLEEKGLAANQKTLRSDLEILANEGIDIVTVPSKPNKYFWGTREFELPEIKLLMDAVCSSRFITKRKSRELSRKLTRLASLNQREELDRHIYATNRVKSSNEAIYYSVDVVNEAISQKRKISFQYQEYDGNKKKVLRNEGEVYELSPYALFWNEDYYYVVGYSEKHGNVSTFRADRLYKTTILEERTLPPPADFRLEDYSRRIFEMYSGLEQEVKLECKDELMKYIVDRFGEDVETRKLDETSFLATVNVSLSPTFYAWVFRFAGDMKIVSPKEAVGEIVRMARRIVREENPKGRM